MASNTNIITSDAGRFASACATINKQIEELNRQADRLIQSCETVKQFAGLQNDTESVVSLLSMKNRTMAQYVANVAYLHLRKLTGLTIRPDGEAETDEDEETDSKKVVSSGGKSEVVKRLVELRATLERARPLHERVSYQLSKLLRRGTAADGGRPEEDDKAAETGAKPHLDEILDDERLDADDDASGSDEDLDDADAAGTSANGKYVPPRIAPAYFDESVDERRKRRVDTLRKRALTSSLIDELSAEYQVGPTEFHEADGRRTRQRREKEREAYEESNFRRLQVSKREKRASRGAMTSGSLNELVNFGDTRALFDDGADGDEDDGAKKRRKADGKRGGRLGKKARKFKKKKH